MSEQIKERMEKETEIFSQIIRNLQGDLNRWLIEEVVRLGPRKFASSNFTVQSKEGTFIVEMREK